ncbi:enoyl-CoA hydratase/isomerase family protein [Salibacterium aidingense]|uniref:enoyl-CoA hydratase/isomerase family protein n=1 Tax=Salibacterium aidingense TaxID=384933 RepID=UPI003BE3414C
MNELIFEEKGPVAIITLNRPDKRNAMNSSVVKHLTDLLIYINNSQHIASAIITGKGKAFIAGADIKEYSQQSPHEFALYQQRGRAMYELIENNEKTIITAVNGMAFGGGFELVLASDLVIADKTAKMGLPEIKLGLIPGGGGIHKLSRLIGNKRAKEYLLTGKHFNAEKAEELGIVNKVVDSTGLYSETFRIAEEISAAAPLAARKVKHLVNEGLKVSADTAFSLEQEALSELYQTRDAEEGIQAFVAKRSARFQGK